MLSIIEKSELRSAAAYIKQLPGMLQQWSEIRQELAPRIASSKEQPKIRKIYIKNQQDENHRIN